MASMRENIPVHVEGERRGQIFGLSKPSLIRSWRSRILLLPGIFVLIGVLVPLLYLLLRAFEASPDEISRLLFRKRNFDLLLNTLGLTGSVLLLDLLIAFPLAILSERCAWRGAPLALLAGIIPLAIPGYIVAYVLLSTTGSYGMLARTIGLELSRVSGFWGALLALSMATFPYLFLNLRSALRGLDGSLEEIALSLGHKPSRVFIRVVLPHLKPALVAGSALIAFHVIGDFGVVTLMRYETYSYAIFLQYSGAFDRVYAAWLALMLLAVAFGLMVTEHRVLSGLHTGRTGPGVERRAVSTLPARKRGIAWLFVLTILTVSTVLPVLTLGAWTASVSTAALSGVLTSLIDSIRVAIPSALAAVAIAVPIIYMDERRPSVLTRITGRIAYFGYATPPLAFALSFIFATLILVPSWYQTIGLLVAAYTLHFLVEALGPVRSSLKRSRPSLEEAARALGLGPIRAFFRTTVPLILTGVVTGGSFVFLSSMKELPIAFLLAPAGFDSLALNAWGYTNEAQYALAAPYALGIVLFSSAFIWLILKLPTLSDHT